MKDTEGGEVEMLIGMSEAAFRLNVGCAYSAARRLRAGGIEIIHLNRRYTCVREEDLNKFLQESGPSTRRYRKLDNSVKRIAETENRLREEVLTSFKADIEAKDKRIQELTTLLSTPTHELRLKIVQLESNLRMANTTLESFREVAKEMGGRNKELQEEVRRLKEYGAELRANLSEVYQANGYKALEMVVTGASNNALQEASNQDE